MRIVGVDGCKRGWIAIALDDNEPARGYFISVLDELLDAIPDAQAVAIDIPIGLPATGPRQADLQARERLGPRRNSVFLTPIRDAITARTHAEATAISTRVTGRGISRQAFALAPKIQEAERWSMAAPVPVWEVHPEVSFAVMMDRPAQWPKSTWSGMRERQFALAQAGISLGDLGPAGHAAGVDDVLDAAAAAWSAARIYRGEGISLPDPPEATPESSKPMAIWA
jgi:predicted RNase H-like nuclease